MSDTERRAVPERTRFEVFKRDKFTCQYCGLAAPSVVLNCDHIRPVAGGGTNDLLNLITSCRSCNGGKGAIALSDDTAVEKQRQMLDELEDRRQQIEMMLRWRDELQDLQSNALDALCDRIAQKTGGAWTVNDAGRADLRRWMKRHAFDELLGAIDESFDMHLKHDGSSYTMESWNRAFGKIVSTASIMKDEASRPHLRRLLYIQGIIRNRIKASRYNCLDYLEHLVNCGADIDAMERNAKSMRTFEDFEGPYDAWLSDIGRPF